MFSHRVSERAVDPRGRICWGLAPFLGQASPEPHFSGKYSTGAPESEDLALPGSGGDP